MPEGFKIQVLANQGYILNQLFYAKGDKKGLIDFNTTFTKKGFLKIQAVVLNLLFQCNIDTDKPFYPPRYYIVWLNNLFINVKLLTKLCNIGIRNIGTIYTTKIKRKKLSNFKSNILIKARGNKKKIPTKQINKRLFYFKLYYTAQLL